MENLLVAIGGPERGPLEPFDVVRVMNGQVLTSGRDIQAVIESEDPRTTFHYIVYRRGQLTEADVTTRLYTRRDFVRFVSESLVPAVFQLAIGAVVFLIRPGRPAELAFPRLLADRLPGQRHVRRRPHHVSLLRAVPHGLGLLAGDAHAPRPDVPAAARDRAPLPASGLAALRGLRGRGDPHAAADRPRRRAAAAGGSGRRGGVLGGGAHRPGPVAGPRERGRAQRARPAAGPDPLRGLRRRLRAAHPRNGRGSDLPGVRPVPQRDVEAAAPLPDRHGLRHGSLRPLRRAGRAPGGRRVLRRHRARRAGLRGGHRVDGHPPLELGGGAVADRRRGGDGGPRRRGAESAVPAVPALGRSALLPPARSTCSGRSSASPR